MYSFLTVLWICFDSKHGKPPTLLIDVKEFSQIVVQRDEIGIVCGGRHPQYTGKLRAFLKALKDTGAILVFFAVGNKLNDEPALFIPKREVEYQKHVKLLKRIDQGTPIRKILSQKNRNQTDIRATLAVEHNTIKLCKIYGEMHFNYVRHNQEIARYANEHKDDVLAIISGDTDFLVFDGSFEYWPAIQINMREMMGKRICRKIVWDELQVTPQQLAMVGAVGGSVYLPHYIEPMKQFYERIEHVGSAFSKIIDLAAYVRKIPQTLLKDGQSVKFDLDYVAKDVFGDNYTEGELNAIENGLVIYNLKFRIPTVTDPMLRTLMRFDRVLYKLLTDDIYSVRDIAYVDFDTVRSKTYAELVCPLMQRILGILFLEQIDTDFTRKVCMKYNHDDLYEVVDETPCYPPNELRIPFRVLYDDRNNDRSKKWRLLLWTLGLDSSRWEAVKKLGHIMVTPVLTLMYLVEVPFSQSSITVIFICFYLVDSKRSSRLPRPMRS